MTAKNTDTGSVKTGRIARHMRAGLAAALLVTTSSVALHAQDRDLQKELDQLKAQIAALKAAVGEQKVAVRKTNEKIKVVASRDYAPPIPGPGYTAGGFNPIGGFDDKKLHFGGITITPGGFIAAEGFFRSRTTQSGISTAYSSIPFNNSPLSKTNETKFSVQQTRLAMLAEGNITQNILASGYIETDFQGGTTTGNDNQSNSFSPRIRNIYTNIDFLDSGFHVLAGQNWSLTTLNSKGITPRNEVAPAGIDGQPAPGYHYTRQPQIRITKDFNKKLWLALSAEASATTFASGCASIVGNTPGAAAPANSGINAGTTVTCLATGTGSNFAQAGESQQVSLNHIPDIIGKAVYEARIADRDVHFEGFGMARNFYDTVGYAGAAGAYTTSANQNTWGISYGGGIVAAIIPNRLDLFSTVLAGRGIGRYAGSGSSAGDATLNANGSIKPINGVDVMVGLTFHATPQLDLYAYAGMEQQDAALSTTSTGAIVGFGVPTGVNALTAAGCNTEGGACTAQQRRLSSITGGFWDKIYEGKFGYIRAGMSYAYIKRDSFGVTPVGGTYAQAHTDDHMIYTSLRYYPF